MSSTLRTATPSAPTRPMPSTPAWHEFYSRAPFLTRCGAYFIDVAFMFVLMISGGVIGYATRDPIFQKPTPWGIAAYIGFLCYAIFYMAVRDGRKGGAGLGKRAVGLMVVHLPDNRPCTRWQSAARSFVMGLCSIVPILGWLVEPLAALLSAGGQRLGDRVADTQVIRRADYAR